MAKLEDFVAFKAAQALHEEHGTTHIIKEIYEKCLTQTETADAEVVNYVKEFYKPFTADQISKKIAQILSPPKTLRQRWTLFIRALKAYMRPVPKILGDWYFTGNYPTPGGNRVVNRAFINFYEGKNQRAY